MGAAYLHVVGALNIFLVEALAPAFTVCYHVTARRVCCARGRFLAMGVARMRPWPHAWCVARCGMPRRRSAEVAKWLAPHGENFYRVYIVECEYLVLCELAV